MDEHYYRRRQKELEAKARRAEAAGEQGGPAAKDLEIDIQNAHEALKAATAAVGVFDTEDNRARHARARAKYEELAAKRRDPGGASGFIFAAGTVGLAATVAALTSSQATHPVALPYESNQQPITIQTTPLARSSPWVIGNKKVAITPDPQTTTWQSQKR